MSEQEHQDRADVQTVLKRADDTCREAEDVIERARRMMAKRPLFPAHRSFAFSEQNDQEDDGTA